MTSFVDREDELRVLENAYLAAADGHVQCVLVTGEAGMGKTRLAHELLRRHRKDALGLTGRAHPLSDTASFGLWAEAIERHLRDLDREQIASLCDGLTDLSVVLRSVAVACGTTDEPTARPRLLQSLVALLEQVAARRPLIVVLDDAHDMDPSSWDVLHYLVTQPEGRRILVIVTARNGQLTRQPVAMRVLLDLDQQNLLRRIKLGPLAGTGIRTLAEHNLGRPQVQESLCRVLAERSRGNPFFVLGLLQMIRQEGLDACRLAGGALPDGIADGVRAQVAAFTSGERRLLGALAVADSQLEPGDLSRISGCSLEELAGAMETLIGASVVVEHLVGARPTYEIAHPIVRDTMLEDMGAAQRLAMHRVIAQTLLARQQLAEAARHFAHTARAGDHEAIGVLIEALAETERRGGHREGVKLLGLLGELIPHGNGQWVAVADALGDWMYDHRTEGDDGSAVAALVRIDALPTSVLDEKRRAAVKGRLATLLCDTGELDRAARTASEAVALAERIGDPAEIQMARLESAWVRAIAGDIPSWHDEAVGVLARAQELDDPRLLYAALSAIGLANAHAGSFGAAEDALTRALDIARSTGDSSRIARCDYLLAWILGHRGQLSAADTAVSEAKALDPLGNGPSVHGVEASVRWLAGDLHGCVTCARESMLRGLTRRGGADPAYGALASIELGALADAVALTEQGRSIYGDHGHYFTASLHVRHAEGVLAWHRGDRRRARGVLSETATKSLRMGSRTTAAFPLLDLAEMGAASHDHDAMSFAAEHLGEIAHESDSRVLQAMADMTAALAAWDQRSKEPALESAKAAVEALDGSGYRLLHARALVILGQTQPTVEASIDTLHTAATTLDALDALQRRDSVLTRLRGLGSTGRKAAAAAVGIDGLTPREWQVAQLARDRLTAQEMADHLVVSRRTVESHLASIYAKLDVHTRAELARALTTCPEGPDRRPQWTRRMPGRPIPRAREPESPIEDQLQL